MSNDRRRVRRLHSPVCPYLGKSVRVPKDDAWGIYMTMRGKSRKELVKAVAYMRTSSATNVGTDKDSEEGQRAAIEAFAKRSGLEIADWFYDPAVSGPILSRRALASQLSLTAWRAMAFAWSWSRTPAASLAI
jgi:Resolvase, N terminal domain